MKTLNIKNPDAYRIAEAISGLTGESMTHVVTEALRDQFARLQSQREKAGTEELLLIANRVSAHVKGPYLDHAAFLYDENGLPK